MNTPVPPPMPTTSTTPCVSPESSTYQRIRDTYEPMEGGVGLVSAAEALLKTPGRIVHGLQQTGSRSLLLALFAMAVLCLGAYGITMGMFSWGHNLWISPLKLTFGQLLSAVICLPSLQMSTTLRPLIGDSDMMLRTEKRFFLSHWMTNLEEDLD